jgi:FkbM family methyltransferase
MLSKYLRTWAVENQKTVQVAGITVPIDESVMSEHMLDVIQNGQYEREEASQIHRIVQEGDRVVELGAGIGFIGALVAQTAKASSIDLYEANPKLISIIEQTRKLNGAAFNVHNKVVLSDNSSGSLDIPFYLRSNFWASSLSPGPYPYSDVVNVPTISFADMIQKHDPTMLIVDIEGGELQLFHNVSIGNVKKVYIELHQKVIGRRGMKRVFDFFHARDFHYDQNHSYGSVVLLRSVDS